MYDGQAGTLVRDAPEDGGPARLIVLWILGIAAAVAGITGCSSTPVTPTSSLAAVNNDVGTAMNGLTAAETADKSCGQSVSCKTALNAQMATAFGTLGDQLGSIHMPTPITQQDATRAAEDAHGLGRAFATVSKATNSAQYSSLSGVVNNAVQTLSQDLGSLQSDLKLAGAS